MFAKDAKVALCLMEPDMRVLIAVIKALRVVQE
jgi:hypothetical protein